MRRPLWVTTRPATIFGNNIYFKKLSNMNMNKKHAMFISNDHFGRHFEYDELLAERTC